MNTEETNTPSHAEEEIPASRYDYFNICHHFVRKIKKLNELKAIGKIKTPGFS